MGENKYEYYFLCYKLVILVTGSSGFVGEVLVAKLMSLGYDVIGIDHSKGKYTTKIIDITKPFTIDEKIDGVFHLAAKLVHHRSSYKEYYATNAIGTKNVLEVALHHQAFFVYVSTNAVYGSPNGPMTEDTEIAPLDGYAKTKFQGEKICKEYEEKGLKTAIVRPSVIIGEKRLGLYTIIFKNLYNNSPVQILGNGENKVSFVNVNDLCSFLIFLMEKKISPITVNFGGKIPGTLNFVINELKKHTKSTSKINHISLKFLPFLKILAKLKIIPVTDWQLSVMYKDFFSEDNLLMSTGYVYKYDPIDALKEMADYYKSNLL
mgnify:CR=1 FL=1|tara:strand:+ start:3610 stop:4569 length:960 start_codon:yes stop_codon:yes gene_type:complete